jgi:hypothetical protein
MPVGDTNLSTATAVDRFLDSILTATVPAADAFSEDAVLDATVPNWRWTTTGKAGVEGVLSGWFADPGRFEMLERTPTLDGELVEFVLHWTEDGIPHACHQSHRLRLNEAGRILRDTAFCGGRWDAALVAEMAATTDV